MERKLKTRIKMRVTPEQSSKVQRIVFANNGAWINNTKEVARTEGPFLFIDDDNYLSLTMNEKYFLSRDAFEEVSAELFISTQGTCIQEEQPTMVKLSEFTNEFPTLGLAFTLAIQEKAHEEFAKEYTQGIELPKGESEKETLQPEKPKPCYMIFVSEGKAPKVIHTTLESALVEAKRLSAKEIGREVLIMKKVKSFKSRIVVEVITDEKTKGGEING